MPKPAILINRDAVKLLELGFDHKVADLDADGFSDVEVSKAGTLTVHFFDGGRQAVDVIPGDRIMVTGSDIYVAVHTEKHAEVKAAALEKIEKKQTAAAARAKTAKSSQKAKR